MQKTVNNVNENRGEDARENMHWSNYVDYTVSR